MIDDSGCGRTRHTVCHKLGGMHIIRCIRNYCVFFLPLRRTALIFAQLDRADAEAGRSSDARRGNRAGSSFKRWRAGDRADHVHGQRRNGRFAARISLRRAAFAIAVLPLQDSRCAAGAWQVNTRKNQGKLRRLRRD